MTNIIDYLSWYGHLSFSEFKFNEVDSLIICRISYFPMDGIVDTATEKNPILIKNGLKKCIELVIKDKEKLLQNEDLLLMKKLIDSERFKNLKITGYINSVIKKQEKQFSSIVIDLDNENTYVAYRGTDNTFIGWKEDFNMSYMESVPSQIEAVDYLQKIANYTNSNIILGGHSKGGNLAVYALIFSDEDIQKRIITVYNNDGPGFSDKIIQSDNYQKSKHKIKTFVPQSSIIGMLLAHEENYIVIHSSQLGILQHDIYSWKVTKKGFVCVDSVTNGSKFIDRTLKSWISQMDNNQREKFINTLFMILDKTNAKTINELSSNWYLSAVSILKSISNLDAETNKIIRHTLFLLFKSATSNIPSAFYDSMPKLPKKASD